MMVNGMVHDMVMDRMMMVHDMMMYRSVTHRLMLMVTLCHRKAGHPDEYECAE